MRHTRNRQLAKAHKDPIWMWTSEPTDRIDKQRHWMTMGLKPKLDPTFKWHREYNNVSYYDKLWESEIYMDLYKQDSVYF